MNTYTRTYTTVYGQASLYIKESMDSRRGALEFYQGFAAILTEDRLMGDLSSGDMMHEYGWLIRDIMITLGYGKYPRIIEYLPERFIIATGLSNKDMMFVTIFVQQFILSRPKPLSAELIEYLCMKDEIIMNLIMYNGKIHHELIRTCIRKRGTRYTHNYPMTFPIMLAPDDIEVLYLFPEYVNWESVISTSNEVTTDLVIKAVEVLKTLSPEDFYRARTSFAECMSNLNSGMSQGRGLNGR